MKSFQPFTQIDTYSKTDTCSLRVPIQYSMHTFALVSEWLSVVGQEIVLEAAKYLQMA